MKRIKYFIFMIGVCLLGLGTVNAAKFNVTTNKTTVVVGSTVKITVGVSGSDAAGWEYCLNYDSSMFSLTSHSSTCVLGGTLAGNKSVTFTFKAKKSGSYTFSLRDASILNDSAKEVLSSSGKVTVKAKTQAEIEASYSTNANLSALRVVDHVISPDFDKDKLEYTLEVENDVENIEIKATRADSSASVSGTGVKNLSEGLNKFNIVVTAEKGNKKTYVINVTRKELNPIHVDIDGFNYTVVRKADVLEAPTYYSSTEIEIDGEMVPAFNSDITGYTLVGLKDEEGNIDLYRYTDTGYVLYKQIGTEGLVFIPGTNEKLITGYEQSKNITINNVNVKVYVDNSNSDYVLVYGMNASNGKSNWYIYDTLEGTFQRYEEKIITEEKKDKDIYFILTLVFGGVAGLTLLLVIILLSKNSKIRQKNEKLISMLQALREAKKDKDTFVDKSSEEAKESEKKRELQEELRKKQEEFMDTGENELVEDDVELEESTPVKKSKRGRKKKE
ncbi:MAG: cadherin-like beta sandwich domain-containing protein [Bacilli bacterium]|nr:cadherin-like beta sandwich domain-containing protein [Bacilli bacterium]